jgi:hypothetical protein
MTGDGVRMIPISTHMAMYDDQAAWFGGLIDFIRRVDAKSAAPANGR